MTNQITRIPSIAAANALLTTVYIMLIGLFFNSAQGLFGDQKTILIPIAMLSLFVFSAALTGSLILGRPILWYIEGRKQDAVKLFVYTLGIFLVTTLVIFGALFWISRMA